MTQDDLEAMGALRSKFESFGIDSGIWKLSPDELWIIQTDVKHSHFGVKLPIPAIHRIRKIDGLWTSPIDGYTRESRNTPYEIKTHMLSKIGLDSEFIFEKVESLSELPSISFKEKIADTFRLIEQFGSTFAQDPHAFVLTRQRTLFNSIKASDGENDLANSKLNPLVRDLNQYRGNSQKLEELMGWKGIDHAIKERYLNKLTNALDFGNAELVPKYKVSSRTWVDGLIKIEDPGGNRRWTHRSEVQVLQQYDSGDMWHRLAKRAVQQLDEGKGLDIYTYWKVRSTDECTIAPNLPSNFFNGMNAKDFSIVAQWTGPDSSHFNSGRTWVINPTTDGRNVWADALKTGVDNVFLVKMKVWERDVTIYKQNIYNVEFLYEVKELDVTLLDSEGWANTVGIWFSAHLGIKYQFELDNEVFTKEQRRVGYDNYRKKMAWYQDWQNFIESITDVIETYEDTIKEGTPGGGIHGELPAWYEIRTMYQVIVDILLRGQDKTNYLNLLEEAGKLGKNRDIRNIKLEDIRPKVIELLQDPDNVEYVQSWLKGFIHHIKTKKQISETPSQRNWQELTYDESGVVVLRGLARLTDDVVKQLGIKGLTYNERLYGPKATNKEEEEITGMARLWNWMKSSFNDPVEGEIIFQRVTELIDQIKHLGSK
ncbi:MAG: hypothetical protein ACFFCS_20385 [Candidatus Hodarchaeota archaeon]